MKWRDSTLGEIVERDAGLIQTGPFGSQLHRADYQPEGIPVIMPSDIADGRVSVESVARVSGETADRLGRHKVKPRTIVLPRRGEVTKRAFIRSEQEGWICGTGCLKIELGGKELVPEFLYYFMDQSHVVQWLEQHAVGTTMLNLSAGIVAQLPIRYPAVEVQYEIASVLSTYDDLIENNRRRMALFETAARVLYREWFVRLQFPGHEHTSTLDGTPEAWEVRPLDRCVKFLSGGTPNKATSEYWDGDIPWVSSGELTTMRIHDTSLHVTSEAVQAGSRLVPRDTILVVVRGMSLATEFRIAMTGRPVAFNQDLKGLVPQSGIDAVYLFHALETQREQIRDRATEASHGTKKLDTQALASVTILVPSVRIQEHFREIVDPLNSQWDVLHQQTERLRTARDLLLPRLMSGEIAV